jgi:hypothetical protein
MWDSLLEYDKLEWRKVRKAKSKKAQAMAMDRFDSTWTQNGFIYQRQGMSVHWAQFNFDPGGSDS